MPLRPVRTVHVTTREQLDAALQAADRVVVEGDEHLLSYAVAQASSEPGNRIDLELDTAAPPPPVPSFTDPLQAFTVPPAPIPQGFESVFGAVAPPAAAAPAPRAGSRPWTLIVAVLLVMAIALGLFTVLSHHTPPAVPQTATQPDAAPPPAPPPQPEPEQGPVSPKSSARPAEHFASNRSDDATLIQAIAWPSVAIIAILALALIARQAIAAGRNVEFSWKVTEKVSGRVVITKVKAPSAKRGRTAPA